VCVFIFFIKSDIVTAILMFFHDFMHRFTLSVLITSWDFVWINTTMSKWWTINRYITLEKQKVIEDEIKRIKWDNVCIVFESTKVNEQRCEWILWRI